eukprot:Gregarina_sp_Poly_1__8661@NODE_515_length_7812_cov_238_903163_g409_i0_p2_GENE_NODE_515_length_7812_cov_238_903163_g409_i0NODE_515_length_7812_cov_238_903163_g409_i0_p2_ORF_typecomplete_len385_score73_38_NODE_515_length_7812_cov_238_903163_g409_i041905344
MANQPSVNFSGAVGNLHELTMKFFLPMSQSPRRRHRDKESFEIRKERERVEAAALDEEGYPVPKRPRLQEKDAASQAGSIASSSWRSSVSASSRRSREQMVGGHVIPQLDEALKGGSVLMFKRTSTPRKSTQQNPPETARLETPSHSEADKIVPLSHDESEFVKQLAEEISEKSSRDLERDWYTQGDGDGDTMGGQQSSLFDQSFLEFRDKESRYKRDHEKLQAKRSLVDYRQEDDLWELNRLTTAGLHKDKSPPVSFQSIDDDRRDVVITKDVKPAFLLDRDVGEIQNAEISIVKDPTSDMAKLARKGSAVLNQLKEETEKTKLKDRFWELAGSTLGKVLGVTDESSIEAERAFEELERSKPFSHTGCFRFDLHVCFSLALRC